MPNSATASLGLDVAGDQVIILDSTGAILDRVTYGAATANVSFARGSGGVCDAPPTADVVQLETSCTTPHATAGYTPGTQADGSAFVTPPPPAGDTCQTATALAAGASLTNQSLAGFHNNYNASDCFGYDLPGPDQVYSFTVPGTGTTQLEIDLNPDDATLDGAIYFIAAPASNCDASPLVCLAMADDGVAGDPESAVYVNTTGADQAIFVVIDSYDEAGGTYDLSATLSAP